MDESNQALSTLPHFHPDSPCPKLTDLWGSHIVVMVTELLELLVIAAAGIPGQNQ